MQKMKLFKHRFQTEKHAFKLLVCYKCRQVQTRPKHINWDRRKIITYWKTPLQLKKAKSAWVDKGGKLISINTYLIFRKGVGCRIWNSLNTDSRLRSMSLSCLYASSPGKCKLDQSIQVWAEGKPFETITCFLRYKWASGQPMPCPTRQFVNQNFRPGETR